MVAVVIPAGKVAIASGDVTEERDLYEDVTHGKIVYVDTTNGNKWRLADKNTLAPSRARAIAIGDHKTGETASYAISGSTITFASACLTQGVNYYLGDSGAIIPESDIASADYVVYLGCAASTTVLKLNIGIYDILKP